MRCSHCNTPISRGTMCSACYAYLRKHPEGWYPLPPKGEIQLASNGDIICHICGAAYPKLGNHISFKHHMTPTEYKDAFNLYHSAQLTNERYKKKMRKYTKKYYKKVVKKNLIKRGRSTRFLQGKEVIGRGRHIK